MAPHLDHVSESVAVVVDGNIAQAFSGDCAPAETRGQVLAFSWSTEGGETVSRAWRPWADAGENSLGFCANALELPNDARPPVRIETMPAAGAAVRGGSRPLPGEPALAGFGDGFDGRLPEGEAVAKHDRRERRGDPQPLCGETGGRGRVVPDRVVTARRGANGPR